MSILKDLFVYLILAITIYYFFRCRYLKSKLFKQRENFIKTLEHDFRVTLLAQIRGLDLIQKNFNLTSDENSFVSEINNSCKYTLDMISMILKIYKIENKDLFLNFDNINLYTVISKVFYEYNRMASEKGIVLKFEFENKTVFADSENLTKVFKILIYTVMLYIKKNTTINISLKKTFNSYRLKINYKGNSISNEEYERMFSLNPTYSAVGHGIQMYLCKKIIELHNWSIEYQSESDNHSFVISIPAKPETLFQLGQIYKIV